MRLPGHLLHQIRVGVGVGAVLLAGCDLVDDVKGRLAGDAQEAAAAEPAAEPEVAEPAAVEPTAEPAPKRDGLVGKVAQAVDAAKAEPLSSIPASPRPEETPTAEAEDVTAFVPFGSSSSRPPTRIRAKAKPRPKPEAEPLAIAEEEPCDPEVSTAVIGSTRPHRVCPACGRG